MSASDILFNKHECFMSVNVLLEMKTVKKLISGNRILMQEMKFSVIRTPSETTVAAISVLFVFAIV